MFLSHFAVFKISHLKFINIFSFLCHDNCEPIEDMNLYFKYILTYWIISLRTNSSQEIVEWLHFMIKSKNEMHQTRMMIFCLINEIYEYAFTFLWKYLLAINRILQLHFTRISNRKILKLFIHVFLSIKYDMLLYFFILLKDICVAKISYSNNFLNSHMSVK